MDDTRIWAFEESLWKADRDHYAASIDEGYVAVIPSPPYLIHGKDAADTLAATPRWAEVAFADTVVTRPEEGLIVIAYRVTASGGENDAAYEARCSSVYRRLGHEDWRVVQHQQSPVLVVG